MDELSARPNKEIPPRIRLVFAFLTVFWIIELVPAVRALMSRAPDLSHNQHWVSVALSGGSLLLAISMLIRNRRVRLIGLGLATVALVLSLTLRF